MAAAAAGEDSEEGEAPQRKSSEAHSTLLPAPQQVLPPVSPPSAGTHGASAGAAAGGERVLQFWRHFTADAEALLLLVLVHGGGGRLRAGHACAWESLGISSGGLRGEARQAYGAART